MTTLVDPAVVLMRFEERLRAQGFPPHTWRVASYDKIYRELQLALTDAVEHERKFGGLTRR